MNLSFSELSKKLSGFFSKYHFLIFFVFLVSGLIAAVLIINTTVLSEQDDGYVSQINESNFDEATIQRLDALNASGETTKKLEMSGRISPF